MIRYINSDGWLQSPYFHDCKIKLDVSEEDDKKLNNFQKYHNWRYKNNQWALECIDEDNWFRLQRQRKCFDVIDNKSNMWYQLLTPEQNTELKQWYQDWLNITKTKVEPKTPIWLK